MKPINKLSHFTDRRHKHSFKFLYETALQMMKIKADPNVSREQVASFSRVKG
jgi:hypothetical protein